MRIRRRKRRSRILFKFKEDFGIRSGPICRLIADLLPLLAVCAIVGILFLLPALPNGAFSVPEKLLQMALYLPLLVLSHLLHELAHAVVGVSQHAIVYEIGRTPDFYYTLVDTSDCSRQGKIRIYAAGIEANLILAGLFLFLATRLPDLSFTLWLGAVFNIERFLLNLAPFAGSDGTSLFVELCNLQNFELALKRSAEKDERQRLQNTRAGRQCLKLCSCIVTFRKLSPVLEITFACLITWCSTRF